MAPAVARARRVSGFQVADCYSSLKILPRMCLQDSVGPAENTSGFLYQPASVCRAVCGSECSVTTRQESRRVVVTVPLRRNHSDAIACEIAWRERYPSLGDGYTGDSHTASIPSHSK